MMAYATKYQPDKLELIKDLIVFAGMANVADVMPITMENHYMWLKGRRRNSTISTYTINLFR